MSVRPSTDKINQQISFGYICMFNWSIVLTVYAMNFSVLVYLCRWSTRCGYMSGKIIIEMDYIRWKIKNLFYRVMEALRLFVQLVIQRRIVTLKVALLHGELVVTKIIQLFTQMSLWLAIGLTLKFDLLALIQATTLTRLSTLYM